MDQATNLSLKAIYAAACIYTCYTAIQPYSIFAWYNPFEYDTSAPTSAIGSGLQEEKQQAEIEMAKTRAARAWEQKEGFESEIVERVPAIGREKQVAQTWEKTGPQKSEQTDEARITSEIAESKAAALGE